LALPEAAPYTRSIDYEMQLIECKTIESIELEHTQRAEDLREVDRRSPERVATLLKPFAIPIASGRR
jgi:hypothetical protein